MLFFLFFNVGRLTKFKFIRLSYIFHKLMIGNILATSTMTVVISVSTTTTRVRGRSSTSILNFDIFQHLLILILIQYNSFLY